MNVVKLNTNYTESSKNEMQSFTEPWGTQKRQRKDEAENETAAKVKRRRSGSDMVAYLREKNNLM